MSEKIPLVRTITVVRSVTLSHAVNAALGAWFDYASEGRDLNVQIRYSGGGVSPDDKTCADMAREITVWIAGDKT